MSVLPAHLSLPCPCFSYVAVDLCGPFVCKREGASKTMRRNPGTMKVWAVLLVCLQVKAVKIYLVGACTQRISCCHGTALWLTMGSHWWLTVIGGAIWCPLPGRGKTQFHAMTGTGLLGQVEARQSGSFILQGLNSAMVRWRCM